MKRCWVYPSVLVGGLLWVSCGWRAGELHLLTRDSGFATDGQWVYVWDKSCGNPLQKPSKQNQACWRKLQEPLAGFQVLDAGYARGQRGYYYTSREEGGLETLQGVDGRTFRPLDEGRAIDATQVWEKGRLRAGADPVHHLTMFLAFHPDKSRYPTRLIREDCGFTTDGKSVFGWGMKCSTCIAYPTKKNRGCWICLQEPLASFELLNAEYAKGQNAYYFTAYGGGLRAMLDVDSPSFQVLGAGYAKDARQVWRNGEKIPLADQATFTVLQENPPVAKDRFRVYDGARVLKQVDPSRFVPLGWTYGRDDKHIYLLREPEAPVLKGADLTSFRLMGTGSYATDKTRVYLGEQVLNADPATFQLLGAAFYSKDASKVFYCGKEIPGANPRQFKLLPPLQEYPDTDDPKSRWPRRSIDFPNIIAYARDEQAVYHWGKRLDGADPHSFLVLNSTFAWDKARVYYDGQRVAVDRATFRCLEKKREVSSHFTASAEDKDHWYGIGNGQFRKMKKSRFWLW